MDMPPKLQAALEELMLSLSSKNLAEQAKVVSDRYRFQQRTGDSLLSRPDEAVAYALVRMPATFGAVFDALEQTLARTDPTAFRTLLDVGAGTGAATCAAVQLLSFQRIVCLERADAMRRIGQNLLSKSEIRPLPTWKNGDLTRGLHTEKADLVIASYMLNELAEQNRITALLSLWQATQKMLLIVEPGTPEGFRQIMRYRSVLLENGAFLIAPCPHHEPCPLSDEDWCHFSSRIARTKNHRRLKNAVLGYEDEKFCYLAASKTPASSPVARILRPVRIYPGHVHLTLCKPDGHAACVPVSKKDKDLYKKAKKAKWGSSF